MTYSQPSQVEAQYLRVLRRVIGSQVIGVRYLVPAGSQWPDGREDGLVHEVDQGIELVMVDRVTLRVRWEMQGENEFLSIAPVPSATVPTEGLVDAVDVSSVPEWASILGRTIAGAGIAFHAPSADNSKSVWALRFDLEGGAFFVIALGEVREGVPAYLPDAVVVLFDKEDAEAYRSAGSATPAWGENVPLS